MRRWFGGGIGCGHLQDAYLPATNGRGHISLDDGGAALWLRPLVAGTERPIVKPRPVLHFLLGPIGTTDL